MPISKPLLTYAVLVLAGESARAATSAELFLRVQTEPPARLIEYCRDAAPETREELTAEYEIFKAKFAEAAAPLIATLPTEAPPEVAADIDRLIGELGARQLQEVKQLEPRGYCRWLLRSLRSTTTERLSSTMQAAFNRYTELARVKRTSPAQR